MKKQFPLAVFIGFIFALAFFTSCKKNAAKDSLDPQVQQHNDDANNYKGESDQADDDINNSLSNVPSMGGRPAPGNEQPLSSPLCGVVIDSSQLSSKILKFNFDGVTPCFSPSRTRGGQIVVQLTSGTYWKDAGSILTITYINFKITRLSDNKSITFNGSKTLKNINGNDWLGFLLGASTLKYQERALGIAVTFDNNLNATWNSARVTEWKYTPANSNNPIPYAYITFTAVGDTSLSGFSNVDSWGVNRYGKAFTTYYHAPILSNTYCGLWRFNSGELVHHVNNSDFTFTLGVDQNGNPTPYVCAYGFKVVWSGSNGTASVILSY